MENDIKLNWYNDVEQEDSNAEEEKEDNNDNANKNNLSQDAEKKNSGNSLNKEDNPNQDSDKSLLNKKRKYPSTKKEYICEIKRLMHESGLEKNYLFIKKSRYNPMYNNNYYYNNKYDFSDGKNTSSNNNKNSKEEQKEQKEKEKEEKKEEKKEEEKVKPLQLTKSLHEWYEKLNFLPFNNKDAIINDKNLPYSNRNDGYVKFNGIQINTNQNCNNYKHYIYLINENEIDLIINKGKIFKWKVNFLCDSYFIAIGIADKNTVLKNNNVFLSDDEEFNNGTFCLINTYNKEFNMNEIHPWNCNDKNKANHVASFPFFKKEIEITMIYNSKNLSLEFRYKKKSYIMTNVSPMENNDQKILTPCIVFYYPGDEVNFSPLIISD